MNDSGHIYISGSDLRIRITFDKNGILLDSLVSVFQGATNLLEKIDDDTWEM